MLYDVRVSSRIKGEESSQEKVSLLIDHKRIIFFFFVNNIRSVPPSPFLISKLEKSGVLIFHFHFLVDSQTLFFQF